MDTKFECPKISPTTPITCRKKYLHGREMVFLELETHKVYDEHGNLIGNGEIRGGNIMVFADVNKQQWNS